MLYIQLYSNWLLYIMVGIVGDGYNIMYLHVVGYQSCAGYRIVYVPVDCYYIFDTIMDA